MTAMDRCTESHTCCWSLATMAFWRTLGCTMKLAMVPLAEAPNTGELSTHRPGSMQNTERSMGSLARRYDPILGDHPVLLASGHDLTRQQQQRLVAVVHQHQRVHLVASQVLVPNIAAIAVAHQSPHLAGFRHFHRAVLEPFIQGEEGNSRGGFAVAAHHREQKKVATRDRSEHPVPFADFGGTAARPRRGCALPSGDPANQGCGDKKADGTPAPRPASKPDQIVHNSPLLPACV